MQTERRSREQLLGLGQSAPASMMGLEILKYFKFCCEKGKSHNINGDDISWHVCRPGLNRACQPIRPQLPLVRQATRHPGRMHDWSAAPK